MLPELRQEGKVKALGLSQVDVEDIKAAGKFPAVSTVQNRFGRTESSSEDVLECAVGHGIGFIPWVPHVRRQACPPWRNR